MRISAFSSSAAQAGASPEPEMEAHGVVLVTPRKSLPPSNRMGSLAVCWRQMPSLLAAPGAGACAAPFTAVDGVSVDRHRHTVLLFDDTPSTFQDGSGNVGGGLDGYIRAGYTAA